MKWPKILTLTSSNDLVLNEEQEFFKDLFYCDYCGWKTRPRLKLYDYIVRRLDRKTDLKQYFLQNLHLEENK